MNNLSHLNITERKEFLMKHLRTGKMMSATWSTAKSGLTTRTVKLFAERAFSSGDRRYVQPNAVAHKPEYLSVVDMEKFNSGSQYPWVNLNVLTIKELRVGSNKYEF